MKYDTQIAYTASYVIFRRGNKVAFVLRSNTRWMDNYYGLPSGKVEKEENFVQAAIREAKEEVGVSLKLENLALSHIVHRKADDIWIDAYFEVVDTHEELINAEPHIHSELAWLDIHDLPENVIPAVRDVLVKIEKGEKFSEFGW